MYELNNLNYRTTYYGIYTGQLGFVLYKCLYYKLLLSAKTQKGINIPPEAL